MCRHRSLDFKKSLDDYLHEVDTLIASSKKGERNMDLLEFRAIDRAEAALQVAKGGFPRSVQTKAVDELFRNALIFKTEAAMLGGLERSENEMVQKAVVAGQGTLDSVFANANIQESLSNWIASAPQGDVLSALLRMGALKTPRAVTHILLASAGVGNIVAEGAPKPLHRINLAINPDSLTKSVAMVVITNELARSPAALPMFKAELANNMLAARNPAIVAALVTTSTHQTTAGSDALVSLEKGLALVGAASGIVAVMSQADAAFLALSNANKRGMGIRGGLLLDGLEVVVVDGMSSMILIPASRFSVLDAGIEVKQTGEAVIDMADTPSGASRVSLFQTNSVAVLCESTWLVQGATDEVVIVTGA